MQITKHSTNRDFCAGCFFFWWVDCVASETLFVVATVRSSHKTGFVGRALTRPVFFSGKQAGVLFFFLGGGRHVAGVHDEKEREDKKMITKNKVGM